MNEVGVAAARLRRAIRIYGWAERETLRPCGDHGSDRCRCQRWDLIARRVFVVARGRMLNDLIAASAREAREKVVA